jgi:polysaccharide export outer membrane protein
LKNMKTLSRSRYVVMAAALTIAGILVVLAPAEAQSSSPLSAAMGVAVPADYTIGPDDVLGVLFWHEPEMSGDVVVRPDGAITLPLLGELKAAGLTPSALRTGIQEAAAPLFDDPNVAVIVRQINSRKVFITGQVNQSNKFPVSAPLSVLQLISVAGGLKEYAHGDHITILRNEQGRARVFKFNYKTVSAGKEPDFQLQPGDTVVVP